MKKRTQEYFVIQKAIKLAKKQTHCPEFPHFGAHYPDATCIDGFLWDLDSGDSDGLTIGGDDPCPRCNTYRYVSHMFDCEQPVSKVIPHLNWIFKNY